MPTFIYTARDVNGGSAKGKIDAASLNVAQDILREQNLILISIVEAREHHVLQQLQFLRTHVKTKDVVVFSRQLAVLISATVPIVRALRILGKQTESKSLQGIIAHIADDVDAGTRLSVAMKRTPHVFDDFFVYMIRAGETTGRLDEVLVYLADQKEKDYELQSRIIGALIYPALVVVMMIGIFLLMMIYVVPKLLTVVQSTGAALPFVTRLLLFVSDILQQYWPVMLVVLFVCVGGYLFGRTNPTGRRVIDRVKLHIPVLGKIYMKVYLARMSRSLANLLASGVPVNRSIEIVADIVGNQVYHDVLLHAQRSIESGKTLSQGLQHKRVPLMMSQMVSIGEETGRLDQILQKVSDFYTAEVTTLTGTLVSLIEPLIIILLGVGALVLISGILMPIYNITAQIS